MRDPWPTMYFDKSGPPHSGKSNWPTISQPQFISWVFLLRSFFKCRPNTSLLMCWVLWSRSYIWQQGNELENTDKLAGASLNCSLNVHRLCLIKALFLVQPPWLWAWGMNWTLGQLSINNQRRLKIGFVPSLLKRKWKSYREFMMENGISLTFSVARAVGTSTPTYFSWSELLPNKTLLLCRCSNEDQEPLERLPRSPLTASLFRLFKSHVGSK